MNRDDIIRMAGDSGMFYRDFNEEFVSDYSDAVSLEHIERFFHMAQAAEREACAKVADEMTMPDWVNEQIAKAIRAKGQQ